MNKSMGQGAGALGEMKVKVEKEDMEVAGCWERPAQRLPA